MQHVTVYIVPCGDLQKAHTDKCIGGDWIKYESLEGIETERNSITKWTNQTTNINPNNT